MTSQLTSELTQSNKFQKRHAFSRSDAMCRNSKNTLLAGLPLEKHGVPSGTKLNHEGRWMIRDLEETYMLLNHQLHYYHCNAQIVDPSIDHLYHY